MTDYQKIHKKTNKYLKRKIPTVLVDIINDYNRLFNEEDKALKLLKKKINANLRRIIGKGYRLLKVNINFMPFMCCDKEYYSITGRVSINHYSCPLSRQCLHLFNVNRHDLTLTMDTSDKIYQSNNLRYIFNDFKQEYKYDDNLRKILKLKQQIDIIKSADE